MNSLNSNKNLIVSTLENAGDIAGWDHYLEQHPHSNIYHERAWQEIFANSFGYKSWLLMVKDAKDGRVQGILPLYLVSTPFQKRLVSVPFRDRGGILWSSEEAFEALVTAAREKAKKLGVNSIELKTISPYSAHLTQKTGLSERMHWIHSEIDLRGMTSEGLWEKIPSRRSGVKQAEQEQLTFEEKTHAPSCLREWYHLYIMTQKRLGIPPFPMKFFANIQKLLSPTGAARFFFVCEEGHPLAAAIILTHKKVGIYGYGASNYTQHLSRPTDYLLFRVLKLLIEEGFETFDMGSDSPKQEGLLFFKRKWSAEQKQIPSYFVDHAPDEALDSSSKKYSLLRKGLSCMPAPILRSIGNLTSKYFG